MPTEPSHASGFADDDTDAETEAHIEGHTDAETELESVRERLTELLGERSGREVDLITGIVQRFSGKATRLLGEWSQALDAQDTETAVRAVHTLKGSALNLGSVAFGRLCAEVEAATRAGTARAELRLREADLTAEQERFVGHLHAAAGSCGLIVISLTTGEADPGR